MTYRIGDTVFMSQGSPALTVGRDPAKGTALLDRDAKAVRDANRHGYINGIAPERRAEFLGIMDEVKKLEDPKMRVDELQKRIVQLQEDPKNTQFVKYLESEKNHLINISGYVPRLYVADEHLLR